MTAQTIFSSQLTARLRFAALLILTIFGLPGCGTPFQARETVQLSAPAAGRLVLKGQVGDVTLRGDPNARQVSATVTHIGRGATQALADEALSEIESTLAGEPGAASQISAKVDHPRGTGRKQYAASWDIVAPPGTALEISTQVGDISARDFSRGATMRADVGDVRLIRHRGGATAQTNVGDIHAETDGAVDLKSDVGDIHLKLTGGTPGEVAVSADVGDVSIVLPADRRGELSAATDVGRVSVIGPNEKIERTLDRRKAFHGMLGGAASPKVRATADVGDVTVQM